MPDDPRSPDAPLSDPSAADAWLADVRADDAARRRQRAAWLARQGSESSSLAGTLLELAERGVPVHLRLRGGAEVRGTIRAAGADVLVLRPPRGGTAVVAMDAVATVAAGPATGEVWSERSPLLLTSLGEVLAAWAAERPEVTVHADGGTVPGELAAAGTDVVVVRGAPPARERTWVALAAVVLVTSPHDLAL